jgi:hypothetical protein
MTKISHSQRCTNILSAAVKLGYVINSFDEINVELHILTDFILNNSADADYLDCIAEYTVYSNGQERIDWSDDLGYTYWEQGQIVGTGADWSKPIEVARVVDSFGRPCRLWVEN